MDSICIFCYSLLFSSSFLSILARPTTPTTDSAEDYVPDRPVLFDPAIGLPEMEVPIPKPVDKVVLSQHGYKYLMKFGYLPSSLLETGELRSSADAKNAVKTFQEYANLPVTGDLDPMTLAMMDKRRCGMPDIEYGEKISYHSARRSKRYAIVTKGWPKLDLKYRIMNYSPDMQFDRIRGEIHRAFKVWSDASALEFREVYHGDADIEIHFAKGYHSDGYPFDGKGVILAHAFYPGEGRGGDIHFDDDETWTWKTGTDDVNLFSVAAHEFGHSLGLGHSSDPTSLMYPWYQDYYMLNYTLPKDDTAGIVRLYGQYRPVYPDGVVPTPPKLPEPTPEPTEISPIPADEPNPCQTYYDAISMINRELFVFKDKWFWRVNSQGRLQDRPAQTGRFFYGLDDYVDAAYQSPKYGHIVFFRGMKYWVFNSNYLQRDFPESGRPITELGLPHDIQKIDAAFVWGYNKRVYLVSGSMYWRFNEEGRKVDYDYPRDMSIWQGVPTPIDAAFVDWDGVTHFFKGKDYFSFEDIYMRVQEGFPKSSAETWLGCAPEEQPQKGGSVTLSFSTLALVISFVTYFST